MVKSVMSDLSKLTTIKQASLSKILYKLEYVVYNDICELMKKGDDLLELDVGIGTLLIKVQEDTVSYKFIPSNSFDKNVKSVVVNKNNPLVDKLEESLKSKIENIYKDYF